MKTSSAVLSHGAICFSAFHTQKNEHFGCERVKSPFQRLSARDTAYPKLSFAPIQNCILEAIKLHLFFWFQDGEVNCSNITCQPLNCTEAPILLPHSCCPVCPGKCLIFCYMKSWQTRFTRAKKIGTACQIFVTLLTILRHSTPNFRRVNVSVPEVVWHQCSKF